MGILSGTCFAFWSGEERALIPQTCEIHLAAGLGCLLTDVDFFFDDYIVFSTPDLVRSSELTAAALFELLGWDFAKEGRKCIPFGDACDALGVVFNLQASSTGIAHISNTASRVEEIVAEIIRVTGAGGITLTDAQKLRGRMLFAEAQLYGRTGKRCLKALRVMNEMLVT
jgi:hypothetical protein